MLGRSEKNHNNNNYSNNNDNNNDDDKKTNHTLPFTKMYYSKMYYFPFEVYRLRHSNPGQHRQTSFIVHRSFRYPKQKTLLNDPDSFHLAFC